MNRLVVARFHWILIRIPINFCMRPIGMNWWRDARSCALHLSISPSRSLSFTQPFSFPLLFVCFYLTCSCCLLCAPKLRALFTLKLCYKCVCVCVFALFLNFIIAKLNTVKFVCLYVAHSRPQKNNNSKLCLCVCEMKKSEKIIIKKVYTEKSYTASTTTTIAKHK